MKSYRMTWLLLGGLMAWLLTATTPAQTSYLYANNNPSGANSISRYRIESDGSLTALGDTPTGGNSNYFGAFASNRIVVTGNFVYATNGLPGTISGFSVNALNGDLTLLFTPIPVGENPRGFSVRATPDGRFLLVQLVSTIRVFSINPATGALTVVGTYNPAAGTDLSGMAVSRNGALVAVASINVNWVSVMRIDPTTGALTLAAGSPYDPIGPVGANGHSGVEFNATGTRLFVGTSTTANLNVIRTNPESGAISGEISGSPFTNSGLTAQQALTVSPNGQRLYSRDSFAGPAAVYDIDANGTPTPVSGSPFLLPGGGYGGGNQVIHPAGTFFYGTVRNQGDITANVILPNGGLGSALPGSPYHTGDGNGVTWLAIYPVAVGPSNVNGQVSFVTTSQGVAGITGTCAAAGYTNQYNLTVDLTNIGANTFTSPFFSVSELQEANGPPPPNPFRLRTADDFNTSNCTGGLIGTTQAIPGPVAPNQVIPVNFQIAMPSLRRFRFIVNVFATVGSPNSRNNRSVKMGQLAVEATGFDKAGNPILTATFIPEKGTPANFKAGKVTAK